MEDLSTGCKTVLNYMFLCKSQPNDIRAIDVSKCGANALEVLFSIMERVEYSIDLVLRHEDELFRCGKREYLIDNERVIDNLLYI